LSSRKSLSFDLAAWHNLKKVRAYLSQTLEVCDTQKDMKSSFVFSEKSDHFSHQLFKRSENN